MAVDISTLSFGSVHGNSLETIFEVAVLTQLKQLEILVGLLFVLAWRKMHLRQYVFSA